MAYPKGSAALWPESSRLFLHHATNQDARQAKADSTASCIYSFGIVCHSANENLRLAKAGWPACMSPEQYLKTHLHSFLQASKEFWTASNLKITFHFSPDRNASSYCLPVPNCFPGSDDLVCRHRSPRVRTASLVTLGK